MKEQELPINGWGNANHLTAKVFQPEDAGDLIENIGQMLPVLPRGNGRSYGDAALSANMVDMRSLCQILEFDAETGVIHCESGILLADLLPVIVPKGWFFALTPGTKLVTLGGAIAADVHGKNHPDAGCFSQHLIAFQLLQSNGEVVTCSKSENAALFWDTCGGMGWTGIVLSAQFQLRRISSALMEQHTCHAPNLRELLDIMEHNLPMTYTAAWMKIDRQGSGIVFIAEHAEGNAPLAYSSPKPGKVPFFAPNWLMNKWTSRLQKWTYQITHPEGQAKVSLDQYFYPLDQLQYWKRLYGRRGFLQYQFLAPAAEAQTLISDVLEAIHFSGIKPFLGVLKRHGARPEMAVHSFPEEGFSLALDFANTPAVRELFQHLDELVWSRGGKIYLAKDAVSDARLSHINPGKFGDSRFVSLQKQRIAQGLKEEEPKLFSAETELPNLVLCDFDGTLTRQDSWLAFLFFLNRRRHLVAAVFRALVDIPMKRQRYSNGLLKAFIIKSLWRFKNKEMLEYAAEQYTRVVLPQIVYPELLEQLRYWKKMGVPVAIVSASLDVWLAPFCREEGFELIATRAQWSEKGEFTGFDGANCNRAEKVERIKAVFDLSQFRRIEAFGNSGSDIPMLQLAHKAWMRRKHKLETMYV